MMKGDLFRCPYPEAAGLGCTAPYWWWTIRIDGVCYVDVAATLKAMSDRLEELEADDE